MKTEGPFRKALADFIRTQRKTKSNLEIRGMIYSFCCGWTALGDAMDKINKKYEAKAI